MSNNGKYKIIAVTIPMGWIGGIEKLREEHANTRSAEIRQAIREYLVKHKVLSKKEQ